MTTAPVSSIALGFQYEVRMQVDFERLKREITLEFLEHYAEAKRIGWGSWPLMYFGPRSAALALTMAHLPGHKVVLSADEPAGLEDQIRKALIFTDHVFVRHEHLLPQVGGGLIGDAPLAFLPPNEYLRQALPELQKLPFPPFPLQPGAPVDEEARLLMDWFIEPGRPWAEHGFVSYAPFLPPEQVEVAAATKGVSLAGEQQEGGLLPFTKLTVNPKAAAALVQIDVPYLSEVDAATFARVKQDNQDAFAHFRSGLTKAFSDIEINIGTKDFARRADEIVRDNLLVGTDELSRSFADAAKMRALKQRSVLLTTTLLGLSFWLGAPAFVVAAALGKPVWDFTSAMIDHRKEVAHLRKNELYLLTLFQKTAKRRKHS